MATITATDLDTVLHLQNSVSDEVLEDLLDLAIDTLNLYGAAVDNMSGVAGAKSVTVTGKERAAAFISVRAIYYGFYKEIASSTIAGLTVSSTDLMSNPEVLRMIKEAARRLEQHEGVPFKVAEATS